MPEVKAWNLVADIGGTNARFALHDSQCDELSSITVLTVAEFSTFFDGLQHFISSIRQKGIWRDKPDVICLAVACPVDQDLIRFTNSHWTFSKSELSAQLDHIPLDVINDFTAIAYSVSAIQDDEWFQLGSGSPQPDKPIAILGPGTGLGMCTLLPVNNGFKVLDGEGGHIDFAPGSYLEMAILTELKTRFQHVSVERLLSGSGIVNIYQTLCKLKSTKHTHETASEITGAALQGNDQLSIESMKIFCRVLGATAGNLAMITGARGGVYIAGGIPPKILELIKDSECRARFEDKGRFSPYVKNIPLRILLQEQPGLNGAKQKIKLNTA